MSSLPHHFLAIDEEGFALSREVRISDEAIGHEILSNLSFSANGAFQSTYGGTPVLIESFDEPLVAQNLDRHEGQWVLIFPYGYRTTFDPRSLRLDEWDRFHGIIKNGVPFVFSRAAQASFFDLIEDSDDNSITIDGDIMAIPGLFEASEIVSEQAWSAQYIKGTTGWNLEQPAPALVEMLPRLKLPKCRVLVAGCGYGHDAALFAKEGHVVTAMDLSEEALRGAQERYGHLPNLRFEKADIFHLNADHRGAYDLIFEHTLLCAVEPEKRSDLIQKWVECLASGGQLMAVLFAMHKPQGPPFGGSEWEYRERLRKKFQFLFWGRWQKSIPSRQGKELFVFAVKR